ncbi:MAG: hypothetical protein AAFP19_20120, partial [Bacteroidota bacterium]
IRFDEMSKVQNTNDLPKASLKLDRIVLLANEDLGLLLGTQSLSDSRFTTGNQSDLIHSSNYLNNVAAIDDKTITAIELIQDYKACQNYHGNVLTNTNYTKREFSLVHGNNHTFTAKYHEFTGLGSSQFNSGKLRLREIETYGLKARRELPSYKFSYSLINPNYDLNAKDYWGYYKSDYNASSQQSPYTSLTSATGVEAWSMIRIETPLGGFIDIEYESDEYTGVNYSSIPARIFRGTFQQVGSQYGKGNMTIEDDQFFDYLNNYQTYNVKNIAFGCPDRCIFAQQFYSTPASSLATFIRNSREIRRSHAFPGDQIADITVSTNPSNQILNLHLKDACGYDGTVQGNANSPIYSKATASVSVSKVYGGGLRVKSLATRMLNTENRYRTYKTEYEYHSGIASAEPERFTPANFRGQSKNSLLYNRHEFAPNVGYSKVTTKGIGADEEYTDIYTVHDFINYDDSRYTGGSVKSYGKQVDELESNYSEALRLFRQTGTIPSNFHPNFEVFRINQTRNISAFDQSTAGIGKLKKKQVFDSDGNILNEEINDFKAITYTGEVFHQRSHALIPITYDEDFYSVNEFLNGLNDPNFNIDPFDPFTSPHVTNYITVLNTNAFYNKRLVNEIIEKKTLKTNETDYTTEFLEFDPLTGLPTKTRSIDASTGESLEKETVYAHELYPEMGPAATDPNNKNLLHVVAQQKVIKEGELIEGSNTTFRSTYPVRHYNNGEYLTETLNREWNPHKVFLYNGQSDVSQWREEMEYSLFDKKGHVLETKSLGDRYNTAIYGYDEQYIIAEVTDAQYTESAFSGAEDPIDDTRFGGEVSRDAGTVLNSDPQYAHTGIRSVFAAQNQVAFEYRVKIGDLDASRKYLSKVWVRDNGLNDMQLHYLFNGTFPATTIPTTISGQVVKANLDATAKAGNWLLLSLVIDIPDDLPADFELVVQAMNSGAASGYFDDFRFHPINSTMVSYVYQPWSFLPEYVLDAENFYDRTEFNAIGQRFRSYRETLEGEKLLTEQNFHYARDYQSGGDQN